MYFNFIYFLGSELYLNNNDNISCKINDSNNNNNLHTSSNYSGLNSNSAISTTSNTSES